MIEFFVGWLLFGWGVTALFFIGAFITAYIQIKAEDKKNDKQSKA